MIINNFYIDGIFSRPYETNTPLIVNSDTMPPISGAF